MQHLPPRRESVSPRRPAKDRCPRLVGWRIKAAALIVGEGEPARLPKFAGYVSQRCAVGGFSSDYTDVHFLSLSQGKGGRGDSGFEGGLVARIVVGGRSIMEHAPTVSIETTLYSATLVNASIPPIKRSGGGQFLQAA